jgi:hypothetical protein
MGGHDAPATDARAAEAEKHMQVKNEIADSSFGNTYGGLHLVLGDDGQKYLRMGDCFGPDYFGPLTDEQVSAFYVLRGVQRA